MIVRGWQIDETDILDEHDGFAFTVADLIEHVRERSINDFRGSLILIRDVCKAYEPIAAVASVRVIAEAALKKNP